MQCQKGQSSDPPAENEHAENELYSKSKRNFVFMPENNLTISTGFNYLLISYFNFFSNMQDVNTTIPAN